MPHTRWLKQQKFIFLHFVRSRIKMAALWQGWFHSKFSLHGLQLATFSLFPHMAFLLCVHGDRERERTRDLVTPPLIRMSDPLGLGPHSYTSVCVVLGHSVVSDSW